MVWAQEIRVKSISIIDNSNRRALQNWLLVWWEKGISNKYPARTDSEIAALLESSG